MRLYCLRYSQAVAAAVFAGGLFVLPQTGKAQAQPATYTGEAVVVSARALGLVLSIEDTGPLPSAGGSRATQLLSADVPHLLDLHLLSASTIGTNNQTSAQASVANVTVNVPGVY